MRALGISMNESAVRCAYIQQHANRIPRRRANMSNSGTSRMRNTQGTHTHDEGMVLGIVDRFINDGAHVPQ